jgi:predicted RNA binding protein YcfA (HicA-like mRNA interferase family)
MTKFPRLSSAKVLKALLSDGFYIHHQTGSHVNLRHETKTHLHIIVPQHSRDLAPKTLVSIISQAEITVDEFRKLL